MDMPDSGPQSRPWSKPLLAMAAVIAVVVGFCSYDSLTGSDDNDTTAAIEGEPASPEATTDGQDEASSEGAASALPAPTGESAPVESGIGDARMIEPNDVTELAAQVPFVPGIGFTNENGTYFSSYGAPPEALAWMYSPHILFNEPLPAETPTVGNSDAIAGRIDEIIRGERLYGYGSGFEEGKNAPYMLFVDSDAENFTEVVFRPQRCGSDTWWAWAAPEFEQYLNGAYGDQGKWGIPLPANFQMNADDSDFHVMVYDWRADTMIELWKATPSNLSGNPGIEVCWGGVTKGFSATSSGAYPFPVGVDAAGLTAAGLTITLEDVRQGEIRHAIGVSSEIVINNGDTQSFSYPANRNDGLCSANPTNERTRQVTDAMGGAEYCLYEGQYLRLPADFNIDAIEHPFARMVAKAARDYGLIVHDEAGCFCFQAESGWVVTEHGLGPDPWDAVYAGTPEWEVLWQVDWSQLEILPPNWNRPDGHQIPCAVPPGFPADQFPMLNDARCQLPVDPYSTGG